MIKPRCGHAYASPLKSYVGHLHIGISSEFTCLGVSGLFCAFGVIPLQLLDWLTVSSELFREKSLLPDRRGQSVNAMASQKLWTREENRLMRQKIPSRVGVTKTEAIMLALAVVLIVGSEDGAETGTKL